MDHYSSYQPETGWSDGSGHYRPIWALVAGQCEPPNSRPKNILKPLLPLKKKRAGFSVACQTAVINDCGKLQVKSPCVKSQC